MAMVSLDTGLLPLRNYPFQLTATPVAVAESMALKSRPTIAQIA